MDPTGLLFFPNFRRSKPSFEQQACKKCAATRVRSYSNKFARVWAEFWDRLGCFWLVEVCCNVFPYVCILWDEIYHVQLYRNNLAALVSELNIITCSTFVCQTRGQHGNFDLCWYLYEIRLNLSSGTFSNIIPAWF